MVTQPVLLPIPQNPETRSDIAAPLACRTLFGRPVEGTRATVVDESGQQDEDEHSGAPETGPADIGDDDGPGKQEHRFNIEDDKQHCHQVELDRKTLAGTAGANDARFEGKRFADTATAAAQQAGRPHHKGTKTGHCEDKKSCRPEFGNAVCRIFRHSVSPHQPHSCCVGHLS